MKQSLGTLATAYLGKLSYVSETISTALGILVFVLLQLLHFISLFAGYVIVVCLIVIIVCIRYWEKEKITHWIAPCAFVLLLLSAWETNKSIIHSQKETENELIADATESAMNGYDLYDPQAKEWLKRAVLDDNLLYILVPARQKYESILFSLYDDKHLDRDTLGRPLYRMMISRAELQSIVLESKYYLLALYRPYLKKGYEIDNYRVLPESVSLTMRGYVSQSIKSFDEAKAFYYRADSLSNAAATACLANWYSSGFGEDPDKDLAIDFLYRAAEEGSRYARLYLGTKVLSETKSDVFQRAKAEDFLKKASILESVISYNTAIEAEDAASCLSTYYRKTNRFRDAYKLSKKCYAVFTNPNLKYGVHLDNCLSMGYYDEAMGLIQEGEKIRFPNCYLAHAELFLRGEGVEQNVLKAEELLRFAADSLGEYIAYDRLASIYHALGDERSAQLWKRMYLAKFNATIDNE